MTFVTLNLFQGLFTSPNPLQRWTEMLNQHFDYPAIKAGQAAQCDSMTGTVVSSMILNNNIHK